MGNKPQMDLDRPLSWSAISSFMYDKEQWYKKYVLKEEQPPSAEMEFGKMVGGKLEKDPTFLPQIKRHSKMEHEFKCNFGEIVLIGYADSFCQLTNKKLEEYKTGVKKWDQKRVDEHGQITMYCLMHYIMTKIKPEDTEITLWWMPTKRTETGDFKVKIEFIEPIEDNIKMFKTKRTMADILKFGAHVKQIYTEMQQYALAHN
jgi:hypothetical protein